ncbi:MAG: SgcJ/EcaC family oxidoreductase [Vicinamibacterales bacterium]
MCQTLILAAGLFTAIASAHQTPPPSDRDAAIREVVKAYVDAREKIDPAATSALFTDDADQLTSSGEWRKGREALVRGSMASSRNNAGKRTITVETIRFPTEEVAIADGRYTIAGEGATRNMWTSFVLVRSNDRWRITAIRNMLPAEGGR